jgi:hypothetical protein
MIDEFLYQVTELDDYFTKFIKDDPVRPNIPIEQRVNEYASIFALVDDDRIPMAMTCVQWLKDIPTEEEHLKTFEKGFDTAVFYTIWSYRPGYGADVLRLTARHILKYYPATKTLITLSPKTEMAKKFHLKNGAKIYQENETSINFLYHDSTWTAQSCKLKLSQSVIQKKRCEKANSQKLRSRRSDDSE